MAHNLELDQNGNACAAFAMKDAWHKLGTVLDHMMTAEEAMEVAKLGQWDVRKVPMVTTTGAEVPDMFASVRTSPHTGEDEVLGVVGDRYHPVQNEEHAEFLNLLVDESGAHFDTAGSLRGGREVFITMKMPTHMKVGGVDAMDLNLIGLNSHDGKRSFTIVVDPIRVVCANTQALALKSARKFCIRHTSTAKSKLMEVRSALDMSFAYLEEFEKEAEAMINETMGEGRFMDIINREFGPKDDQKKAGVTRSERLVESFNQLYFSEKNSEIVGTNWGAYQAITEYADHYSQVKTKTKDHAQGRAEAIARAERVATGGLDGLKETAFNLFRVPAAV